MHLFSNNAETTLASALTDDNGDPDFNTIVAANDGSADTFAEPSATANKFQLATLTHSSMPGEWEVVRITSRDGNTFTVERGYEYDPNAGSPYLAWPVGARLSARVTRRMLETIPQLDGGAIRAGTGLRDQFIVDGYPALRHQHVKPTDGYPPSWYGGGFALESVGGSVPVDLGEAIAWTTETFNHGSVVVPASADGFQYWLDITSAEGGYSQSGTAPAFNGDAEPTLALRSGNPVGFWVPTPLPVVVESRFRRYLVVTEVGFIAYSVGGATTPSVSIGTPGNPGLYASNVALSQITGSGMVHRIAVAAGGQLVDRLRFSVDTAATGGHFTGRFYWRGFFVGDVPDLE